MSKPKEDLEEDLEDLPYTTQDLIKVLQKVQKKHGILPVYYMSKYDWDLVMPLRFCRVERNGGGRENEPECKYVALN